MATLDLKAEKEEHSEPSLATDTGADGNAGERRAATQPTASPVRIAHVWPESAALERLRALRTEDFASLEDVKQAVGLAAQELGFGVRVLRSYNPWDGLGGHNTFVVLVCEREGKAQRKKRDVSAPAKRVRPPSRRCGCGWRINAVYNRQMCVWELKLPKGQNLAVHHNHAAAPDPGTIPANKRMAMRNKEIVGTMRTMLQACNTSADIAAHLTREYLGSAPRITAQDVRDMAKKWKRDERRKAEEQQGGTELASEPVGSTDCGAATAAHSPKDIATPSVYRHCGKSDDDLPAPVREGMEAAKKAGDTPSEVKKVAQQAKSQMEETQEGLN